MALMAPGGSQAPPRVNMRARRAKFGHNTLDMWLTLVSILEPLNTLQPSGLGGVVPRIGVQNGFFEFWSKSRLDLIFYFAHIFVI